MPTVSNANRLQPGLTTRGGQMQRTRRAGLDVDEVLAAFLEQRALPGSGVEPGRFWQGFAALVHDLGPKNRALLAERETLQDQIDGWHLAHRGQVLDPASYHAFLANIGYLLPDGPDFSIETGQIDPEVATIAGPQLVVPVMNARYALNAANARWGSLYDALYGTDAMGDLPQGKGFDPARGARVVAWAKDFLDRAAPLQGALWAGVTGLTVAQGVLVAETLGGTVGLADPGQLAGWLRDSMCPWHILLRNNGLLIEVLVDPSTQVGKNDPANISDVWLEAALSAIMDCEDSVAAVDGADKVVAYANWLGLMHGDLAESLTKGGKAITRRLNPDIDYEAPGGRKLKVKCRALMLVRNVGHLMTNPAILDRDGLEVGEGLMDAMITALCAIPDLKKASGPRNSATGSIYVVKPKMHGPQEVAFACEIFDRVETVLDLPRHTVKLGIMDEERRTSANLKECIRAAKHRLAFINTGFLDRTGDEIHTSMEAGPMVPKGEMKSTPWIKAYENRNVDIGLACGLQGKAQIGKGMWAAPDLMAEMLAQKGGHPEAGASCAWVPSPTAAVLHATHYHATDVFARQRALMAVGMRSTLDELLTLPLAQGVNWDAALVQAEVDNNTQGILGYVVRWVDQGIGCSKVPDIHDVALMEDRATCRISSQALANWLHHAVISEARVMAALQRMAAVVDGQNAGDPAYHPMAPGFDGLAFQAACDLVFLGRVQPSGYTEPVLHGRRLQVKQRG